MDEILTADQKASIVIAARDQMKGMPDIERAEFLQKIANQIGVSIDRIAAIMGPFSAL